MNFSLVFTGKHGEEQSHEEIAKIPKYSSAISGTSAVSFAVNRGAEKSFSRKERQGFMYSSVISGTWAVSFAFLLRRAQRL
jgi:hypothetical protein